MTAEHFSVLLSNPDDPPQDKLAALLAKFHNVTAFDGKRMAQHAWGFFGERLSQEDAQRLVALAAEAGFETRVFGEKDITPLPPPQPVTSGRVAADGFYYTLGTSTDEHFFPWAQLSAVCAVGLREETTKEKIVQQGPTNQQRLMSAGITMMTGIPIKLGKKEEVKKIVTTSEFFLYMDFFSKSTAARLHIDAQRFNYFYLAERKLPHTMGNFKFLLQDVVAAAPTARRNRAVRMILQNQPYASMGYASRDDYEKECLWLYTI